MRLPTTCRAAAAAGVIITIAFATALHASEAGTQSPADASGETTTALISPDPLAPVLKPLADFESWLDTELGLSLEFGYTLIFQTATDAEGQDELLSGSYDIAGEWTLADDKSWGSHAVGFTVEGGRPIGSNRDEDLSANIGTLLGINDDLDSQEIAMTELWWSYRSADERFSLSIGKLDQTSYLDANRVANDETAQFLASPLVNNPAIAFPDNGLGINMSIAPHESWYLSGAVHDAYASAGETGFGTIGDDGRFYAVEAGVMPVFGERGGAYRFMLWHSDTDELDSTGFATSFDQEIADDLILFSRYGYDHGEATDFEHFVSGGIGVEAPFGRADDLIGLGVAWGEPHDDSLAHETLAALFYRVQLTDSIALTPDVQLIVNPRGDRHADTVGVFGVRMQAVF